VIRKVLEGKTNLFAILVDRYKNLVFSTLLARLNRVDDAEDLAQEAFLKAYRELGRLEDPQKFGPWLKQICENLVHNFHSSHSVRQRDLSQVIELPIEKLPDTELEQKEQHERLQAAIDRLKPEQREVILLYYFNQPSSLQKVADFLGLPLTTVKGRVEHARNELRDLLDRRMDAYAKQRRLGQKFTKNVMALLPFTLWRVEKPTAPFGLGAKVAMGVVVLLGIGLVDFFAGIKKKDGRGGRIRTDDPLLPKKVPYPIESVSPIPALNPFSF